MTSLKKSNSDMPYEKFLELGPSALSEAELLAIILRTGTQSVSAKDLAIQVLNLSKHPNSGILGLYDLTLEDLMQIKGIGEVKAVKLKCILELSMRISQASAKKDFVFDKPQTVADYLMERLRHKDTECVWLLCLDNKGQLIGEQKLSEGSVRMSLISPREVFMEALRRKAVSIILAHNHPSGDPTPSKADRELTKNVHTIGEMMDISLVDHIVIGDNRYVSFRELGYI